MNILIILAITVLVIFLILRSIVRFSLKLIGCFVLVLALLLTVSICISKPELHKPLSLETIEYLLKINKDGSLTTTKQVTRTVLKEETQR